MSVLNAHDPRYLEFLSTYTFADFVADGRIGPLRAWERSLRGDWPVHQPLADNTPIPGVHWFAGCDPDSPRVDPLTGVCTGCGELACRECGRSSCPDHAGLLA